MVRKRAAHTQKPQTQFGWRQIGGHSRHFTWMHTLCEVERLSAMTVCMCSHSRYVTLQHTMHILDCIALRTPLESDRGARATAAQALQRYRISRVSTLTDCGDGRQGVANVHYYIAHATSSC